MRNQLIRGRAVYAAVALACLMAVAGCGGGGSVDVVVVGSVSVPQLDILLSRPGPQAIQLDWSDDPIADTFTVSRNGFVLADTVLTTTLVDASVRFNVQYCYQVFGYDRRGQLVSASEEACVVV